MRASFHEFGGVPVDTDNIILNSLVRLGTIASLSTFTEVPFGPVDFVELRLRIRLNTFASLHSNSGGRAKDYRLEGASVSGGYWSSCRRSNLSRWPLHGCPRFRVILVVQQFYGFPKGFWTLGLEAMGKFSLTKMQYCYDSVSGCSILLVSRSTLGLLACVL